MMTTRSRKAVSRQMTMNTLEKVVTWTEIC